MQVLSLIQRASFTLYEEGLCECSHMWNVTFTQQPDTRTCTLYCIENPFYAVLFMQKLSSKETIITLITGENYRIFFEEF
jgi:hypothetical protein